MYQRRQNEINQTERTVYVNPLVFNENVIEKVGSFTNLGSVVNKEGGSLEEVKSWLKPGCVRS